MEKLLCDWTVTGGQESFVRYVRKVGTRTGKRSARKCVTICTHGPCTSKASLGRPRSAQVRGAVFETEQRMNSQCGIKKP